MSSLSLSKRTTLLVAVAIFGVLLLAYLFISRPAKSRIENLKKELAAVQAQIQQIEASVEKQGSMEEGIRRMEARYDELKARFPVREEEPLRHIAEYAEQQRINLISMKAQRKLPVLQENGEQVTLEGKKFEKIFVSIEMTGPFVAILSFVKFLEEDLPAFITFENLRIQRQGTDVKRLALHLDVFIYILTDTT